MEESVKLITNCWLNYLSNNGHSSVTYLSPIQGEKPGWYIWLNEGSGVYEMQLLESEINRNKEESRFILKHYPYPETEEFDRMASSEQVVRLSEYFDNTPIKTRHTDGCACSSVIAACHSHERLIIKGIPHWYCRGKINRQLFTVGEVVFRVIKKNPEEVSLISQDRLVLNSVAGVNIQHNGSRIQLTAPGDIDREVFGWEISWQLFEVFIKEVLGKMGFYPRRCKRRVLPGMVYYQEEGGEIWGKEDPGVTKITHTYYF